MTAWLIAGMQAIACILLAPLLIGLLKLLKCKLQNRKGPNLLQPYRNLLKLFAKDVIFADTASPIFKITPYIVFCITCTVCLVIPLVTICISTSSIADIIVIVCLLALARFFLTLAGMDIGTAFGGIGSSREMMVAAIAEPAMLMAFLTLATITSSTNIAIMVQNLLHYPVFFQPSLIFVAFGFVLIAIAETGRIPVDNPATHLELTMIHEAMILEYSGRHLALLEWASYIKFMIYNVLFINLFFPWGISTTINGPSLCLSIFMLLCKLLCLVTILAIVETHLAKLRLFRVPYLLQFAFLFCLLGLLIHVTLEVS
jgi:formate hydrogenlyase subunit 4